jgi:putative transposase
VFFSDSDRLSYLSQLRIEAIESGLEIQAYCLMTNHIHLVVVPMAKSSIARAMQRLNMHHAQRINRMQGWSGHLWQGRFYSSPLDEAHFIAAIRYVERNPVRAKMVARAEDYEWSSARAHCGQGIDHVLGCDSRWARILSAVGNWSEWLAEGNLETETTLIRARTRHGLPCGSDDFLDRLEAEAGRSLRPPVIGRPRRRT